MVSRWRLHDLDSLYLPNIPRPSSRLTSSYFFQGVEGWPKKNDLTHPIYAIALVKQAGYEHWRKGVI